MKAVLLSIRSKYCELIASGEKTIEVRKTRPKIDTPFKCYIYCTKATSVLDEFYSTPEEPDLPWGEMGNQKVIGEFVCDEIQVFHYGIQTPEYARSWQDCYEGYASDLYFEDGTMLSRKEIDDYGAGKFIYAWHISDLVIYDEPKELSEFEHWIDTGMWSRKEKLSRPPQSWYYVEELT